MKITRKIFAGTALAVVSSMMWSCVSTETIEPLDEEPSEGIVLNLSVREEGATRASSDHKLRYTAKLFYGSKANYEGSTMQKKEIIEGTSEKNQIIFDVPSSQTYTIVVFADYIPEANINSSGSNKDQYYNTGIMNTTIQMLKTPGSTSSTTFSPDFFNNDNYDCFYACVQVNKTDLKVVCDLELKRAVAKVRFVDTSSSSGDFEIGVTKLGHWSSLEPTTDLANMDPGYSSFKSFPEVKLNGKKNFSSSAGEKEVMFYYTFANPQSSSTEYNYIKFTATHDNGTTQTFDSGDGKIEIRRNYITTVKGNFLSDGSSNSGGSDNTGGNGGGDNTGGDDNPGGNGGNGGDSSDPSDPTNEYGPIYLNLSISKESWNSFAQ